MERVKKRFEFSINNQTSIAKGTDIVINVFNIRYYSHLKKCVMEWLVKPSDLNIMENNEKK